MAESKRLNVTVPESMHEEWTEAVEEEEVAASISELIRNSVNRNLDGALGASQGKQGSAQANPSDEVMSYLQRIDGTLSDVQERLERLEEESRTSSESGGVDLQKVARNLIPESPVTHSLPDEDLKGEHEKGNIVTAEDLAQKLDADYAEVLDALLKLEPRDPFVQSVDVDGETYWWVEP